MKRKFNKIILVTGQSNAMGYYSGERISHDISTHPNIFGFCTLKSVWIQFDLHKQYGNKNSDNVSFAYWFALKYINDNRLHTVGIITVGRAGTPISFWTFPSKYLSCSSNQNYNTDTGTVFNEIIYNVNNALEVTQNKKVDIVLWHQGESDENETNMYYLERLQSIISKFRCSKSFGKHFIFIAGELKNGKQNIALNMLNFDKNIYTSCSYTHFIDSYDNVHFTSDGHKKLGIQYYFTYINMINAIYKKYKKKTKKQQIVFFPFCSHCIPFK